MFHFDNTYLRLPDSFYSRVHPTAVRAPKIAVINTLLAKDLGIDFSGYTEEELANVFSGCVLPPGADPIAQAYAGHQYGHFTFLGDGRAILLGEHITPDGRRYDVQLKGPGQTPYSRRGDGRAALGPMLREYIISEAMQALGIPTTRSLAVIDSGETVQREQALPGAILTRIAASHIRVGSFEFAATLPVEELRAFTDYTIDRHFPQARAAKNPTIEFLRLTVERQAKLIAQWMLFGFAHGVMNTDNMSICGETIDYGPCAFLDVFDPSISFSSIDRHGRYSFGNQPRIGQWNLLRFAETLLPILSEVTEEAQEIAEEELKKYGTLFHQTWLNGMREKIGLFSQEDEDEELLVGLLTVLEQEKADFANSFRGLSQISESKEALFQGERFQAWERLWRTRLEKQSQSISEAQALMERRNPVVIPRNHLVEEALEAATDHQNFAPLQTLVAVLQNPFSPEHRGGIYAQTPAPSAIPYRTYCGT